jgi:DHA2 family multidrug resistance protein-like MFS transporter
MIVGTAPPERAGAASGISETSAEFGGALGIAVLGSLGAAVYRDRMTDALPAGIPSEAAAAARETLGAAVVAAEQMSGPAGDALIVTAREAFVRSLQITSIVGAVGLVGMAVLAAILLRRAGASSEPPGQEVRVSEGLGAATEMDRSLEIAA